MKIKYIHFSEPEKEKVFDTKNSYRTHVDFLGMFFPDTKPKTPEEWDACELSNLKKKLEQGHILSYEVIN